MKKHSLGGAPIYKSWGGYIPQSWNVGTTGEYVPHFWEIGDREPEGGTIKVCAGNKGEVRLELLAAISVK